MSLVLVIGGVRSGKSAVAERIAAAAGAPVCYLATGSGADPEMAERIATHRARRPAGWRTIESDDPADVRVAAHETLLVDGIAPWIARRMGEEGLWTEESVAPLGPQGRAAYERAVASTAAFAREAAERSGLTVVVAEESGLGPVPTGAGMRRYLDLAGQATQALAEHAEQVLLVVAGQSIDLLRRAPDPAGPPSRIPVPPWPDPPSVREPWEKPRSTIPPNPTAGPSPVPVAEPAEGPSPVSGAGPGEGPSPLRVAERVEGPSPVSGGDWEGGGDLGELRVHGDGMVAPGQLDFAVNVVPGGPPEWLREAMAGALDRVGTYPDERAAVAALAARHGRPPDEVIATNGSAEAFWLLAGVLRPRRAVVVHPSFTEPEVALRAAGYRVERVFRDAGDFALDPSAVPEQADLVVVGNPNNPTGTLDPAAVVARLARPGRVLVVDEAFMELAPGEPGSLAGAGELPGLVVVRSLTKLWSLAGIRAGYLLAPAGIVAAARAGRQPWSVNGPACAALTAWAQRTAASGGGEAVAIAGRVAAARAELAAGIADLPGVRVWPSAANFLLLRVPDGPAVRARLAERRIAVRRADTFPGLTKDHLRVAVRGPGDNRRLVETLREVLQSLAPVGSR
jgi:histidinol-phosphate/aromatic aminotransferase/cobyric acid decarboxylase-like protein/adenosyl cobinamide kinase/adenosyl cobinamide phosphate guanylyltransferase